MQLVVRLENYLREQAAVPFDWATANCVQLAAGWVQAETGAQPLQGLRSTPDAAAAGRRVRKLGAGLVEAVAARWGALAVAPAFARVGDVVYVPNDALGALGICVGERVALRGPEGVVYAPMTAATHAWRLK